MAYELSGSQWVLRDGDQRWPLADFAKDQEQPFYLYDLNDARLRAREFLRSGARVHYAMKANSNPRLLKMFAAEGLGCDVVSMGELRKALDHGFAPDKIIFSGVGKGPKELELALSKNIFQINVESFEELQLLEALAKNHSSRAHVALRINIHVTAPTHKNIQTATEESKFGLDMRQLPAVLEWLKTHKSVTLSGLAVHVGSQITDVGVFKEVSRKTGEIFREVQAQGFALKNLDLGGGLGLDYKDSGAGDLARLPDYFSALLGGHGTDATVVLEPGRFLVARMGVLCAQVVHVKRGINLRFLILNAGMNALMRPALYEAYHRIEPLVVASGEKETYNVVGPICESTDILGEGRSMSPMKAGDWVGVFDAGAYGMVMANTYNEMPLPAQVTILDGKIEVS